MKNDFKNKDAKELSQILKELRAKIMQAGFDLADKKLKDTSQIKKTKKEIARILTELKIKTNSRYQSTKNGESAN